MKKFGAFKIISNRKLIVEYYNGVITSDDLIYLKKIISKEPNCNFYSNTILDFRDCDLHMDRKGISTIIDFLNSSFKKKGIRKVAYLTSTPNNVVITTLYSMMVATTMLNFNLNVFSTIGAAVKMFGYEVISEKELIDIIDELKTKPNILHIP